MSNRRKIAAKRRHRQRANKRAHKVQIDIETRDEHGRPGVMIIEHNPTDVDSAMRRAFVMQDHHIGLGLGAQHVMTILPDRFVEGSVIMGGDYLHGYDPRLPDAVVKRGKEVFLLDWKLSSDVGKKPCT